MTRDFIQFVDDLAAQIDKDKPEADKPITKTPERKLEPLELTIDDFTEIMNSIGEGVEPETILDVAKAFIRKEGAQPNKQAMVRSNLMLQMYIDAYSVNHNPAHLWRIYQLLRSRSLPIPEWFLGYLDGVAHKLVPEDDLFDNAKAPKDSDCHVSTAVLGTHTTHKAVLTLRGLIATELDGKTEAAIAAMLGTSESTIQKQKRAVKKTDSK